MIENKIEISNLAKNIHFNYDECRENNDSQEFCIQKVGRYIDTIKPFGIIEIKQNNQILFTDEQIIHLKKDFISEIKYEDVRKIERVYQPKGLTLHQLKTNNQTFKFNISNKVSTIFPYSSFYELILNKNKSIEIIEIVFCDNHKYFLHHGEVRKVEID